MSDAATTVDAPAALLAADGRPYAGLGPRFVAALIDNAFWVFAFLWIGAFVPESVRDDTTAMGIIVFVWLTAWFNYFAFCEWRWGQTIGKNAMALRVIELDGSKPAFGPASVRNVLRLIDFFVVGWVMIATGERRQRLGDKAAKTVVVREPTRGERLAARREHATAAGGGAAASAAGTDAPAPSAGAPAPETPEAKPGRARRLPKTPWDLRDTIWGLIGGLILAIIVAPALVLPFDPNIDSLGALLSAQALLEASLFTVAVGMASSWRFRPFRAALKLLGVRRFKRSAIGWAFLTLFAYYVAAAIFAALVLKPDQQDIGGELGLDQGGVAAAVAAVVLIAVVAPFVEELFFRGFVFGGLRSSFDLWVAVLLSGAVFGLIHAPTGITTVIPLAGLGCALAWLYDRTGSLWPCILIHAINNGLALALTA